MMTFDINEILEMGRNDKCWCGSGLKFKRCHLDRANKKPLSKSEIIEFEKNISKKEKCYAPKQLTKDCNNIIKSHTISKSSGLSDIADNTNHVLGLKQNFTNFQKNKGNPRFERIGINKASIFKGFCGKHDNLLFSCFEGRYNPFLGTKEQCTALAYRSVAKEIYAKESAIEYALFMRENTDRGLPLFLQIKKQELVYAYRLGLEIAILELYKLKDILDIEILNNTSDRYKFLILESSSPIPVVASSITNPTYDFESNYLQSLAVLDKAAEQIIFNAFNSNGKGFLVFSWLKESDTIESFISSLLKISKSNMFSYLVNFLFSSAENIFISPNWWDMLEAVEQKKIEALFELGSDYIEGRHNLLADNHITFQGWEVEHVHKVN